MRNLVVPEDPETFDPMSSRMRSNSSYHWSNRLVPYVPTITVSTSSFSQSALMILRATRVFPVPVAMFRTPRSTSRNFSKASSWCRHLSCSFLEPFSVPVFPPRSRRSASHSSQVSISSGGQHLGNCTHPHLRPYRSTTLRSALFCVRPGWDCLPMKDTRQRTRGVFQRITALVR